MMTRLFTVVAIAVVGMGVFAQGLTAPHMQSQLRNGAMTDTLKVKFNDTTASRSYDPRYINAFFCSPHFVFIAREPNVRKKFHHWMLCNAIIWEDTLREYFTVPRCPMLPIDSFVHPFMIATRFDNTGSFGCVLLHDPWSNGEKQRVIDNASSKQHLFRAQNPSRNDRSPVPMYSLEAPEFIFSEIAASQDRDLRWPLWRFSHWTSTDTTCPFDPYPWYGNDTSARQIDVIFMRDSAEYTAHYKRYIPPRDVVEAFEILSAEGEHLAELQRVPSKTIYQYSLRPSAKDFPSGSYTLRLNGSVEVGLYYEELLPANTVMIVR